MPIFMWSLHGMENESESTNGFCHMTKMAAMPIYGKNLKNLLVWNQNVDDLESWYVALGARVLPSLFKWWPWVVLDLFYGKLKFDPYAFVWERVKTMEFSETIVVLWYKSW